MIKVDFAIFLKKIDCIKFLFIKVLIRKSRLSIHVQFKIYVGMMNIIDKNLLYNYI